MTKTFGTLRHTRLAILAALLLGGLMLLPATSMAATSETLTLNSNQTPQPSSNASGPVTTAGTLNAGQTYTVTVSGTYSAYPAAEMTNHQAGTHLCGTPDPAQSPNPGPTGQDAAFIFAIPEKTGVTCPTLPIGDNNFQISTSGPAGAFASQRPVGSPTAASSNHTYTYSVVGQGESASFDLYDKNTTDNYGSLTITLSPASTTGGGGIAAPPVNVTPPVITGTAQPGDTLSCSTGTWTNSPTAYTYQWYRQGVPIAGANSDTYVVQIGDEATSAADTLTCAVTAANAAGASAPAMSNGVLVAVPHTAHCAVPSGKLAGRNVGVLQIGMTRTRARHLLPRYTVTHNLFDNYCLFAGWGIRAGYPTKALLHTVSAKKATGLTDRIVIALTANPFYSYRGVRPGTKVSTISKHLKLRRFFVGRNVWYISNTKPAEVVFKVQRGEVQEVGLMTRAFGTSRAAERRVLQSFKNA